MTIEVLLTSFILVIFGCIGLLTSNTLIQNVISIEIITLSSVLNLLYYKQMNDNTLLLLLILTLSELNLAILFIVNHKLKKK